MKLNQLTVKEAHDGLVDKKFSSAELTSACLARIKKTQPELNSFITVLDKEALEQAKAVDKKIATSEELGTLEGIPAAIKDVILVQGVRATGGSKILDNYIAPYDATVIAKLRNAGAIFLGKTNCDEFAMGASNENSAYGSVKNFWDQTRVPGGSSGGSATAVAADQCIFALGSDTGGSIRQPAAFSGIVGLKPTYGRVSRYGLMAMASSLDQIGPMTKNVYDAMAVLQAIEGRDKLDSTSLDLPSATVPELIEKDIKGLKIGVPKEYFVAGIDQEVENSVRAAIKKLESLGAKIKEVSLPHTEYALAVYYILMPSEASSNLSRYDGVRYGHRDSEAKKLLEVYRKSRQDGFGSEVKRRIMLGTYALSAGYYDAYYAQAQKVRTLIRRDFDEVFKHVDCLITPTAPTPAFKLGEKADDPLTMYLSDIYTVSANLAGLPGISIPCGRTLNNLPIGLQILGKHFGEETICRVASVYEEAR